MAVKAEKSERSALASSRSPRDRERRQLREGGNSMRRRMVTSSSSSDSTMSPT